MAKVETGACPGELPVTRLHTESESTNCNHGIPDKLPDCGTHGRQEDTSLGNLCLPDDSCPSWCWNHGTSPHPSHNRLDKSWGNSSCIRRRCRMAAAPGTHCHRGGQVTGHPLLFGWQLSVMVVESWHITSSMPQYTGQEPGEQ